MPRLFQKRNGTWVEILSVFQKQGGTWVEILNIFQKISGTWTKVFSGSKVPGNTVPPTITGTGRLFGTLTNTNVGTWTNTPTGYARQWRRGNPSSDGGEPQGYSNISGATSSTYVTTSADNGKYIICQITATNAVGSNTAASNYIYVNKFEPVSLLPYTIAGSPNPGSTLRADQPSNAWKNTTTNADDTYPDTFEYEWSYTDGTIIQSSTLSLASFPRNINSDSLLVTTADLTKQIRVRVKGINTGGEATSNYSLATSTVTQPYRFEFGKTLYVSSNGHIGLDSGGSFTTTMSTGRNIAILVKDLEQYYLAEYSDTSVYYLYIKSYLFNSSASALNAVDYQIKFYNDSSINYCDVYMVRVGTNVTLPSIQRGYYNSGTTEYGGTDGASFFIGAGSTVRIYFGNTPMKTTGVSWTAVNDNLWDVIQTWTYPGSGGDDTFTAVTSAANQSAPFPANTSLPTLSTNTGNFSAGSTITVNPGSWSGTSSFQYELLYGSSTPVATDSTATKTLINTNQYVITNADATASSFYFRGRVTGYSGSGQTGNSAIALSTTSSRSTLVPTSTIAVGTATSSGFTISGVAGPLTGFGGSYVSVSEIQIFNSSFSLLSTITTGLPVVNGTTGAWSYIWTGGSASTTYYAKAVIKATDSDQTTFTTAFSSSIATSAGVSTPTSLSAAINSNNLIELTFSGGSGDQYDIFYANSNSRPTDGSATADFPNVTSPYVASTLTSRDSTRWFWVRKSTGTLRSNWFPAAGTVVTARIPLFSPPTPTITNSAQSSTSLSWHWDQPTPSASQDQPTSWDYNISTSTATPSSWTNITTRPTSGSPLVTSSLSASTTYYLHVRAKNADASTTTYQSGTTSATTPVYSPVVWGAMTAPAFNRLNSSSRLRWGWNNQLPSSGDYTASNITWEWQYSTANTSTGQGSSPTGLISSGTRPNRSAGGLTVGTSTYNNRVSSLSGDYGTGNAAGANEPVAFNTNPRYLRYRAVVVGSDGTTYRSNFSDWV
jgi:hypothetical protein